MKKYFKSFFSPNSGVEQQKNGNNKGEFIESNSNNNNNSTQETNRVTSIYDRNGSNSNNSVGSHGLSIRTPKITSSPSHSSPRSRPRLLSRGGGPMLPKIATFIR